MSIAVKTPAPEEFANAVVRRQPKTVTFDQAISQLNQRYRRRDERARKAFIDQAVRMFANYENKWLGDVVNGQWKDSSPQGSNNVYFTVPLLTAHVDTHTTFYTKVRPKYIAKPYLDTHLNRRLADMCQRIGTDELARMLKPTVLQHEAQNLALATVSYRRISMDYAPHSPVQTQQVDVTKQVNVPQYQCLSCGSKFGAAPDMDEQGPMQCPDESCMSQDTAYVGDAEQTIQSTEEVKVRLPRPKITVPSPIAVQDDFSASTFEDGRFMITRRKIAKKEAEFYYQIDLSSAHDDRSVEAEAQYKMEREPLGGGTGQSFTFEFPAYVDHLEENVEEVEMWLAPCEYALLLADGELLGQKYPNGMYVHIIGDKVVDHRDAVITREWIRIQHGVRPLSNKGLGMTHLADLNDGINNSISLDYAVLRTHGFPLRIVRGKWLSKLPQAAQTLVMEKIPDDRSLSEAVHTEQPSNTSGLLGILTSKFISFMQYIGGSVNPQGMPSETKDILGSATGAAALQEMMSDRMGLPVQMRVQADIDTIYAVLQMLQADERNRQYFIDGGYDETVVDEFFESDLRSVFYLEPAKGTDEPKMDSVTTFKVQSFAQLTAALTGLRQFDQRGFYDIVSALGDTLNLDTSIGAGRREKNLADNRISAIIELYKEQKDLPEVLQMDATTFGVNIYKAITLKDQLWLQSVVATQITPPPDGTDPNDPEVQEVMLQQQQYIREHILAYMYDYDALLETYADWLQSDAGQGADIAIRTAVGMLYADAAGMQEKKKAMEQEEQLKQAMMAAGLAAPPGPARSRPGDKPDNPPGPLKRDGQTGPGRPRDIHPDPQPVN